MRKIIITISISLFLLGIPVYAAENFTQDQVQGVLRGFDAVLDDAVSGNEFSQDNVQGVWGMFIPVLDETAGGGAPAPATPSTGDGVIWFKRP